jgi:hypothetical protein
MQSKGSPRVLPPALGTYHSTLCIHAHTERKTGAKSWPLSWTRVQMAVDAIRSFVPFGMYYLSLPTAE